MLPFLYAMSKPNEPKLHRQSFIEQLILDLQALSRESLLASFRESLDPILRVRVSFVRFRLIGSLNLVH